MTEQQATQTATIPPQETQQVELKPEFTPKKTWCLGRYQVDLPEGVSIFDKVVPDETRFFGQKTLLSEYGGGWKYRSVDVVMPNEMMNHDAFEKRMKARENELKKQPNDEGGSMFVQSSKPDNNTHIIVRWSGDYGKVMAVAEGYKWSDGVMFHLDWKINPDFLDDDLKGMTERLAQLRARKKDEIPKERGFCIPDGIFLEPTESFRGPILAAFRWEDRPDLDFTIRVDSVPPASDPGLLARESGFMGKLGDEAKRVTTLRKGARPLPGLPGGEEILMSFTEPEGRNQLFIWEDRGRSIDEPFLRIEFESGIHDKPSSVTDAEALAFWDAVMKTFRVRVVDSKTSGVEDVFEKTVATGEKCPKDGQWRSVEDGAVLKFVAGQIMPPVIFAKPAEGFLAKLTGKTTTYQAPGHWAWVEEKAEGIAIAHPAPETVKQEASEPQDLTSADGATESQSPK
ncbi:MAG: hypothetical protein LBG61_01645 [Burkholderiales bacterium]|jgi:hypothetical protein|nr:hypothetical protein [Burkholderiales bacterium]